MERNEALGRGRCSLRRLPGGGSAVADRCRSMSEPTTGLAGRLREAAAEAKRLAEVFEGTRQEPLFTALADLAEQTAEAHDLDGPSMAAPAPCCCSYPEWPCPELVRWSPLIDALLGEEKQQ